MKPSLVLHGVVGILLLGLAACKSDPVGRTVPVKGQVTVEGKTATHGSVAFWPDEAKGNAAPFECGGTIAEDGSYTLFTRGKAGAPPGTYKVTVIMQTKVDSTEPTKAALEIPKKYTIKEQTPLIIEVVDKAAPGAYDLTIK